MRHLPRRRPAGPIAAVLAAVVVAGCGASETGDDSSDLVTPGQEAPGDEAPGETPGEDSPGHDAPTEDTGDDAIDEQEGEGDIEDDDGGGGGEGGGGTG